MAPPPRAPEEPGGASAYLRTALGLRRSRGCGTLTCVLLLTAGLLVLTAHLGRALTGGGHDVHVDRAAAGDPPLLELDDDSACLPLTELLLVNATARVELRGPRVL